MQTFKCKVFSKKSKSVIQEYAISELPDSCGENAGKIGFSYTQLPKGLNPSYLNANNCELRVWSGLQDACGQDIYSGDSIEVVSPFGKEVYVVCFSNGAFWAGEDEVELLKEVASICQVI
jgi:hypothetical protein